MNPWCVTRISAETYLLMNEQRGYGPGSPERKALVEALTEMEQQLPFEVPCIVNGKPVSPTLQCFRTRRR